MPIYEFICNTCGHRLEQLCPIRWEGQVACTVCSSLNLRKLVSQVSGFGRMSGGCSGCSGKSCSTCK